MVNLPGSWQELMNLPFNPITPNGVQNFITQLPNGVYEVNGQQFYNQLQAQNAVNSYFDSLRTQWTQQGQPAINYNPTSWYTQSQLQQSQAPTAPAVNYNSGYINPDTGAWVSTVGQTQQETPFTPVALQAGYNGQPAPGFVAGGTGYVAQQPPQSSEQYTPSPMPTGSSFGGSGVTQPGTVQIKSASLSPSGQVTYGPNSTPATQATNTTLNKSQASPEAIAAAMAVLNKYLNNGTIDSGTYQFFKKAVEAWNPENDVDYANILNTFETIKTTDVDPYYKELSRIFIDSLQTNLQYLKAQNALDTTTQNMANDKNIYDAQQKLADRGMLFSGEAVKQLGTIAPFAQVGSPAAAISAIPDNEYGGLPLGTVQQSNKAASSSAQLRYENSLKDLQRQAETYLGTQGAAGLVPEVAPLGGITGDIVNQQKVAQGNVLTGLASQDKINFTANQPTQVFNQ